MPSQVPMPLLIFPCNGNAPEALESQGASVFGLAHPMFDDHSSARVPAVPGGPASSRQRTEIIESLGIETGRFAAVVHPSARISAPARVGRNVMIMAGVVVTSNAVIGDRALIGLGSNVIRSVANDATVAGYPARPHLGRAGGRSSGGT